MVMVAFILLAFFAGKSAQPAPTRAHSCDAPCSVHFASHIEEDEVFWSYNHGRILVYRGRP